MLIRDLSKYLLIASDDTNVFLIEPNYCGRVRVICTVGLSNFINRMAGNLGHMLRLSIDKKVPGCPMVLIGLHHSSLVLCCYVEMINISEAKQLPVFDYILKIVDLKINTEELLLVNLLKSPNTVGIEAFVTRRENERFGKISVLVLTLQKKIQIFEIDEKELAQDYWKNLDQLDKESEFQTSRSIMHLLSQRFENLSGEELAVEMNVIHQMAGEVIVDGRSEMDHESTEEYTSSYPNEPEEEFSLEEL